MEFRNPSYNQSGTFDCEINHPDLGWVPYTVEPGTALEQAIVDAGMSAVAPYTPYEIPLDVAKETAIRQVNDLAGLVRARHITDQPGQEMIYLSKQVEAKAYLALPASPAPNLVDFPLIAAEVGITAPTPAAVAQTWLTRAALWTQLAAQIEGVRLGVIQLISASTTPAQAEAHVATFQSAMLILP